MRPKLLSAIVMVLAVILGACGGNGADHNEDSATSEPAATEGDSSTFGVAADASDADRTIKIVASDELAFRPETVTVSAEETIRFVVTNDGKSPHEFVLGDQEYQDEHEQAMAHGGEHGADLGNVVDLPSGETGELTWTFTSSGEVLFACHVSGHYEGGMVGTITVTG